MNTYLTLIIIAILIGFTLDMVSSFLNLNASQLSIPQEFIGVYDAHKYKQSQLYLKANTRFSMIQHLISTPLTISFILLGGFNWFDQFARSYNCGQIITGLIFTGALVLISQLLALPFSIYRTFVIEEKFGFNNTTPRTFILDQIKGLTLGSLIGSAVLSAIIWFFSSAGNLAWLYCWSALTIFQLLIMYVAPIWIMPLFNKFEPLDDGELKEAIENYAQQQNFKLRGLYKSDGSKRSTKSNAYFTGFGKNRRIVLFDTLIKNHTTDELVAILAHEMGHFKKKHILKMMITSILTTGATFYLLSLFINNSELFDAFGLEQPSIYASLVLFGFLYSPIGMILSVCTAISSRAHEYEADRYAVETYQKPEAMSDALKKLSVDNLSNLTPHPVTVFLSYSHPPALARIKAIRALQVKQ